jgi:2-polyprenyl-3-methyl-5-hydroxy-6-metoxy-1,4-benzoquinol methylase
MSPAELKRVRSFGEGYSLTPVDRFGVWLSSRQIRRHVDGFHGKAAGDFGCGYHASFARTILPSLKRLTLVDVSLAPDLKQHPSIDALEGRLPDVLDAVPSESLDIVLCNSVLEHLREPLAMLRQCRRVLAPGGVALINVPSWRGKAFLEFSAFRLGLSPREEMDDHKRYYNPSDLWPMLVEAGFRPSRIRCFRHKFGLNTFAVCRKDE